MVELKDIEQAYKRLDGKANKTPVMTSRTLNEMVDASVFLKCENFQRIGAFKFRGAFNKISQLSSEQKKKGVITHSSGNHAQAVAIVAKLLHIKAVIVMPDNAPEVKVNATKGYGAKIVFCENNAEAREKTAQELINANGYTMIHPYDDDQIIAGSGTAAYELIKQVGELDYVFCPIGGGGLISGTAVATKGLSNSSIVIGVEPEMASDAYKSFKSGKIFSSIYPDTIADGLRTSLSERTFEYIKKYVDEIIIVSEKEIIDAMKFLWERMKLVIEPSGAVPVAGIIKYKEKLKSKRVGAIISGGNIDLKDFFEKYYSIIPKED
ncbi:MAG: pyridoxal-phosphate dependent enzyme [Candidatus Lokiarchaeota archaeon]|nr:pyridoxal-phosphate dependent enzyme [Candidatus Lokiarchaeota archaeon]